MMSFLIMYKIIFLTVYAEEFNVNCHSVCSSFCSVSEKIYIYSYINSVWQNTSSYEPRQGIQMFIVPVLQFFCLFLKCHNKKLQAPGGWGELRPQPLLCSVISQSKYIKHLVSLGGGGAIPPPSERTQLPGIQKQWHVLTL